MFLFKETSATFALLSCDGQTSRQEIASILQQKSSDRRLAWEILSQTKEHVEGFLRRPDTTNYSWGVYRFVQFTKRITYEEAMLTLASENYYPCNFRELLTALALYDAGKIELPMETKGGNTRGDLMVLGEHSREADNSWFPGAQVSYHDMDSWKLLLARNWKQLMEKKWQGHWHVLVRLGGMRGVVQKFLWYNKTLFPQA